jgi:hypothetical protein
MQITYKGGRTVHIDPQIGRDLIARGEATEVVPPPKKAASVTWLVVQGEQEIFPPSIKATCVCGSSVFSSGATAGVTMRFPHKPFCAGGVEAPPEHVAKQYAKAYADFKSGKEARPSSVSPAQREIERKRFRAFSIPSSNT